jgi:hypothetical protein
MLSVSVAFWDCSQESCFRLRGVTLMIPVTKWQSLAGIEGDMMYADSSSTTDLNPDVDDSVKRKENLSRTVLFNHSLHSLVCVVTSPSAYIFQSQ